MYEHSEIMTMNFGMQYYKSFLVIFLLFICNKVVISIFLTFL